MWNEDLVKLALKTLSCSQKELALRLGVSPTQITKWKKGEHMSQEMEDKLQEIVDIGNKIPSFVLWAGSLQEAKKWEKLIYYLAEAIIEESETGYDTGPLCDELELVCWKTFNVLRKMGIDIPDKLPKELEKVLHDIDSDEDYEKLWGSIHNNPYSSLIYEIYKSYDNVYGFYYAYIFELTCEDELLNTDADNIEPLLMDLAACKIEVDEGFAPNFKDFRYKVIKDYTEWISLVKNYAFRAGTPLRAELMDLVHGPHDKLGHEAEANYLGFKSAQLHPDVYMNELLCGMRAIHQVLPAILKKLGIYDEFKMDHSDFYVE